MRSRFGLLAVLLLIALPTFASDRVIQSGIDPFNTPGNGTTFIDFSQSPIPSGFFCFKSRPFTGRIILKGVPIATREPGALGKTDTIVQRLDDAVFNEKGVANTRIQVRALHLVSIEPIRTACGAYKVEVQLNGEQPVTNMRIVRTHENGGRFYAPVAINGKLVFTPLRGRAGEVLEITRNVRFPAEPAIEWFDNPAPGKVRWTGFIQVDTDNDRVPDTVLPGTTANFAAGASNRPERGGRGAETQIPTDCHYDYTQGEMHCT